MEDEIQLIDGGKQTISCADCGRALMQYRVYAPFVDIVSKFLSIKCPFCLTGSSLPLNVEGMFWTAPISKEKSIYPTNIISAHPMGELEGVTDWEVEIQRRG